MANCQGRRGSRQSGDREVGETAEGTWVGEVAVDWKVGRKSRCGEQLWGCACLLGLRRVSRAMYTRLDDTRNIWIVDEQFIARATCVPIVSRCVRHCFLVLAPICVVSPARTCVS